MWILIGLGIVGTILGFIFLTLAIASGLYYLSELLEEHTVPAKKYLTRLIYSVMAVLTLLALFDGFPYKLVALSIFSHYVYLQNLRLFPVVKLSSPSFVASCVLVLVNHYFWFKHFSSPPARTYVPDDPYAYNYYTAPSFSQVSSFFGICVWLVPFALFVGLSAGENVLPSVGGGGGYATGPGSSISVSGRSSRTVNVGLAKAILTNARDWLSEAVGIQSDRRQHARAQ